MTKTDSAADQAADKAQSPASKQADKDVKAATTGKVAPVDGGVAVMDSGERADAGFGPEYGEAVRPGHGIGTIKIPEGFENAAQSARDARVAIIAGELADYTPAQLEAAVAAARSLAADRDKAATDDGGETTSLTDKAPRPLH